MSNDDDSIASRRSGAWGPLRPYRWRVIFGTACVGTSVLLIVAIPRYLGRTVDALEGPDPASDVPPLAVIMLVLSMLLAITRTVGMTALDKSARMAEYDLRSRLFSHLLRLDLAYFQTRRLGDVMSTLTNDVPALVTMWGNGIHVTLGVVLLIAGTVVVMVAIDPWLTLWTLAPLLVLPFVGLGLGRLIRRANVRARNEMGAVSSSAHEDLTGISLIKTYHLEDQRTQQFAKASAQLLRRQNALSLANGLMQPVLGLVMALSSGAVLWIGGTAVSDGDITLGQLVQFNAYVLMLGFRVLGLGLVLSLLQRGLSAWHRVDEVLARSPAIVDGSAADFDPRDVRGDIELRHLTVSRGERQTLSDVSLQLPAGTITALVGRIGSGKTTLVETIPRLVSVPAGMVFLDGRDVTELPLKALRQTIAYAPQDAYLFSMTIAENIACGCWADAEQPSREHIREAARIAGLERDLAALPEGLDTAVGERGITLSGGQKQRVALARAIASRAKILILDDTWSSVDAETEQEIFARLEETWRGRTVLVISHRLAATSRADQVVVLDDGRVVELGRHRDLLARGGIYAEIYQRQIEEQVTGAA